MEPNKSDLLGKWPSDNNRTEVGSENARVWGGRKKVSIICERGEFKPTVDCEL